MSMPDVVNVLVQSGQKVLVGFPLDVIVSCLEIIRFCGFDSLFKSLEIRPVFAHVKTNLILEDLFSSQMIQEEPIANLVF